MLNKIWFALIICSISYVIFAKSPEIVSDSIAESTKSSVDISLKLLGNLCFWMGLMKIAEKSGLINFISRLFYPLVSKLYKGIPKESNVLSYISLNMSANLLGLGNIATPFGIKAMKEMQAYSFKKNVATDNMCMFLVINTTSITLLPITVIALRSSYSSISAGIITFPTIIATCISTSIGIICVSIFRRLKKWKY